MSTVSLSEAFRSQAAEAPADEWIVGQTARDILGVDRRQFHRIKQRHGVTMLKLPFVQPRYLRRDVEQILADARRSSLAM